MGIIMDERCFDCPRNCGAKRDQTKGFCGEGDKIRVAKIIENFMWEEPCISGNKGALAIFFSGCNLRCDFCQNYQISHVGKGDFYSPKQFRELLLSYDLDRFSSIDLITPTHFSSLLVEALDGLDLKIPVVWNSGGYENVETIEKLAKMVDVFLPDLKYFDEGLSLKLSKAKDYFTVASKAIKKMRQLKKENIFDEEGILQEGVLIRHLVIPGQSQDSKKLLDFIASEIDRPFISVMGQFTPIGNFIKERLKPLEYKIVLGYAEKLGLTNGFFQDLESADETFIPQF